MKKRNVGCNVHMYMYISVCVYVRSCIQYNDDISLNTGG